MILARLQRREALHKKVQVSGRRVLSNNLSGAAQRLSSNLSAMNTGRVHTIRNQAFKRALIIEQ